MKNNSVFNSPAAIRVTKKAMQEAKNERDATPRHLLNKGNGSDFTNFAHKALPMKCTSIAY